MDFESPSAQQKREFAIACFVNKIFRTLAMLNILLFVDSERTGTFSQVRRKLGIFKLLK